MSRNDATLDIPAPDPDFFPRKVNFFEGLMSANSQLGPLFNYTHPGAILALFVFQRGDHRPTGIFEHKNSCDEILICLGSSVGFIRTGQVFTTAPEHDVTAVDSGNPDDYMCCLYFQRQALEPGQHESVGFRCEKCGHHLYRLDFSGSQGPLWTNEAGRDLIPTVAGGDQAAVYFNSHDEVRHCAACGHDNPRFPKGTWGWEQYVMNSKLAARAQLALEKLAG